ncbi:hypothetical protein KKA17_01160 [bacterium]|nr:hypothetical protein [bacterium]MBU1882908.1 hypothetical protein [bacterium]
MKKLILTLGIPAILLAKTYTGCADTKSNALVELSSNINVNIDSGIDRSQHSIRSNEDEDVKSSIQQYSKVTTHLDLVNIKWEDKNSTICASVEKEDQVKHTQALLDKALFYDEKDLPAALTDKVQTLQIWLEDLKQIELLYPVFLDTISAQDRLSITKKEKAFKDIYSKTILQMDSLIWKFCAQDREEALKGLSKKLFNKEDERKGLFESIKSIVTTNPFASKKKDPLINLLEPQITYTNSDKEECAIINKLSLLDLSKKMYADALRFTPSLLEQQDQAKRYKQIENKIEMLNVTISLISLYPNDFSPIDKNTLESKIKDLNGLKKSTYPQNVLFHIQSETPIEITLDGKSIEKNENIYLKDGEHAFTITTQNRCPITENFTMEPFKDIVIDKSFNSMHYPTFLVVSDQDGVNVIVDGSNIPVNKKVDIKKCDGEVIYLAKYGSQSKTDTISLEPDGSTVIELNFLTPQEVAVYNDAKTKKFTTKQDEKFSESLTPLESKKLTFKVETSPNHGSLDLDKSGHFVYTPKENYTGNDSFEYTIKTPDETSSPRVVLIEITPTHKIVVAPMMTQENNETKKVDENVSTQQAVKKIVKEEKVEEKKNIDDEKYEKFKKYVEKLGEEHNIEKINKLKEKYPDMFEKFLKEKLVP